VLAFQDARGLHADGIVGRQTWGALVEAGYRLGDRLLYLRTPHLRGDDVDELQRRLQSLGFDTGRVDGIFGAQTARALEDFQRNAGLTCDGICGPDSLAESERLGRMSGPGSIAGLRERESLRQAPRTLQHRRVVVAHEGGLDAVAAGVAKALRDRGAVVVALQHADGSVLAREANDAEADVFLGLGGDDTTWGTAFYATETFESAGGRRLATLASDRLGGALGTDLIPPRGMRLSALRETRMPAVVCRLGPPADVVARAGPVARALAEAVTAWAEQPSSD
jgi:N-acetylmuramoyl-L-alanine amidase